MSEGDSRDQFEFSSMLSRLRLVSLSMSGESNLVLACDLQSARALVDRMTDCRGGEKHMQSKSLEKGNGVKNGQQI